MKPWVRYVLPFVILLATLQCQADTPLDRELIFDTLMVIDYGQTRDIFSSRGHYYERNPLIHKGSVGQYFLSTAFLHAVITYSLPKGYQEKWQWSTIAIEGAVVGHNTYIGIGIRW